MRRFCSPCAALAAALVGLACHQALAAPPAPQEEEQDPPARPPPPEPVELAGDLRYRADQLVYNKESRRIALDGNVLVERGEGRLYAPRGVLDRSAGTLRLEGGVLAVQGLQVALADAVLVDLRSNNADLSKATMYLKDRAAGPQLTLLESPQAARGAGRNVLVLHGAGVRRLADGTLLAREVSLTPCDCAGPPDYQVLSPEVELRGDRATLRRPDLELFGLAVPLGVPISLPLTERQTGLLAPRFGYQLVTGFGLVQPLFATLGRSWDATIAAGLTTGTAVRTRADAAPGDDYLAALGARTVRGPRLDLELRGAPAQGTFLQLQANLIQDLDQYQSTSSLAAPGGSAAGRGLGGLRGILRATERSDLGWAQAAFDSTLATDSLVLADTQPAVLERALDALRTDAGLWSRLGPARVGLDATFLEDVRIPDGSHPDRRLYGAEARRTLQRLPALFAQLPAAQVAGPLMLGGELSAVRYLPLRSMDAQEQATGFGPTDSGASAALPPAEAPADPLGYARGSVVRFDAAPRLQANLLTGARGAITAQLGGRADAWVFDGDPARDHRRLYGLADLRMQTELSRSYGSFLHQLSPSLQLRAVTPALQGGGAPQGDPADGGGLSYFASSDFAQQGVAPGMPLRGQPAVFTAGVPGSRRAFDEIDGAVPLGGLLQAVARLDQAVWLPGAPGRAPQRVAELTLAQDLVLHDGNGHARVAEAWAKAAVHLAGVSASVRAQFDWAQRAFSGVSGDGSVSDARGDNVHASLLVLRSAASELLRAGIDELFSSQRLALDPGSLVGGASAGVLVRLPIERPPLAVGYTLELHLGQVPQGYADTIHHLSAAIDTPCRCAGVNLALDLPFAGGHPQTPGVRFVLDLKTLGAFGNP